MGMYNETDHIKGYVQPKDKKSEFITKPFYVAGDGVWSKWLEEWLNQLVKSKVNQDQLLNLIHDVKDNFAVETVKILSNILSGSSFTKELSLWGGDFSETSKEATLFTIFEAYLFKNIVDKLPQTQ